MKERHTVYIRTRIYEHGSYKGRTRIIRLAQGESRLIEGGGHTDEGWNYYSHFYTRDGDMIRLVSMTDGSDCDGRLSTSTELECHPLDVRAGHRGTWPDWERVSDRQRDYRAESMGY